MPLSLFHSSGTIPPGMTVRSAPGHATASSLLLWKVRFSPNGETQPSGILTCTNSLSAMERESLAKLAVLVGAEQKNKPIA
jgi:hypothetical protein